MIRYSLGDYWILNSKSFCGEATLGLILSLNVLGLVFLGAQAASVISFGFKRSN